MTYMMLLVSSDKSKEFISTWTEKLDMLKDMHLFNFKTFNKLKLQ